MPTLDSGAPAPTSLAGVTLPRCLPHFPLSPRLLVTPLWGLARLREWNLERRRPLLEVVLDGARPQLTPEQVDAFTISEARGIHLVIEQVSGGFATLEALRDALGRSRAAGKLITVELGRCGNGELYLASLADRVWLRPTGDVAALGVAASLMFGGKLLDSLGLKFDVEAAGAYKAFGETFSRAYASPANREATQALVHDLQAQLDESIASGRRLSVEAVRAALAEAPLSAEDAQRLGLVDGALYRDQVDDRLDELYGVPGASGAPGKARRVDFHRWAGARRWRQRAEDWLEGRPRVVVLHLVGNVLDGEGAGAPAIATGPVCRALESLRDDDRVVGVVLAIRSPGGSATASDAIWRCVRRLVEKKPVVAAFGDVAASGGYYIGVGCNEIVAQRGTITGSIGVVGGKPVIGGLLDKLGVSNEVVTERETADMYSLIRPFSPPQRKRFRASLDRFYRAFVSRVSAGRRAPYEAVEIHARGRVWTGEAAVERGLVDRIGGVDQALARVRVLTGTPVVRRVDVRILPRVPLLTRLIRRALGRATLTDTAPSGLSALLQAVGGELDARLVAAFAAGKALAWYPWDVRW